MDVDRLCRGSQVETQIQTQTLEYPGSHLESLFPIASGDGNLCHWQRVGFHVSSCRSVVTFNRMEESGGESGGK